MESPTNITRESECKIKKRIKARKKNLQNGSATRGELQQTVCSDPGRHRPLQ